MLVPLGSRWGSGACLPSSLFFLASGKGFCSIVICWFFLGRLGFRCLSPFFSLLGFRCLSPFFSLLSFLRKGVLFHHDLLVLPGSGWGSGACLPSSLFFGSGACLPSSLFFLSSGKGFCSIMICWFFLVPAGVPVLVSLIILSSLVPVLVSLLLSSFFPQDRGSVPSCFAGSSLFFLSSGNLRSGGGSGACLPSSLFFLFSGKGFCSIMDFLVPPASGWGSRACLPSSPFFCVPDSSMNFELHMTLVETCVVAVWGLCWCNF